MKIWFDIFTGKQALLFHYIGKHYEDLGHKTLFTTRESGYTVPNLRRLKRDFHVIGSYGGATLKGKLVSGAKRIIELADLIEKEKPDLLFVIASPDATRTAFGLGIPIVLINDTPHAEAVARLSISLSNALIHPSSINKTEFSRYGVTKFFSYNGVDESLWIKDFQYNPSVLTDLGLEEYNYIVLRCEESKSAYFRKLFPEFDPGGTIVENIVNKLKKKNIELEIVAFPRYPEQEEILSKLDVIVPDKSVDTLSLLYKASVALTGGGTMGREASMLGTPTVYTFPWELAVSKYVANLGFPLYHFPDHPNSPDKIIELLGSPRLKEDKRLHLLKSMETPIDGFNRVLKDLKNEL